MSLLLYLLLILIFTVVNTIIIVRINSETQKKIQNIKKKKKELLNEYHTLQKEIEKLKKDIQSLKTKIIEEKSFTQLKEEPLQQKKQEKTDPVDILKQKNIINDEHIKKAKDFIKKSNSNFELLEVLLLLGYIDQNQYQLAKEEAKWHDRRNFIYYTYLLFNLFLDYRICLYQSTTWTNFLWKQSGGHQKKINQKLESLNKVKKQLEDEAAQLKNELKELQDKKDLE